MFLRENLRRLDVSALAAPQRAVVRLVQFVIGLWEQFNRDKVIIRASGLAYSSLLAAVPLIAVVFAAAFRLRRPRRSQAQGPGVLPDQPPADPAGRDRRSPRPVHLQHRQARIPRFRLPDPGGHPAARQRREQLQRHLPRSEPPQFLQQDHRLHIGPGPRDAVHGGQHFDLGAGQRHAPRRGSTRSELDQSPDCRGCFPSCWRFSRFSLPTPWFPYTRVRFKSAVLGAACSAVLFEVAKYLFADSVGQSVRYSTVYGSLAVIPIFLIWLYITWIIVLLGLEVVYTHQHFLTLLRSRMIRGGPEGDRVATGLRLFTLVAQRFEQGEDPPTCDQLSQRLLVPVGAVEARVRRLVDVGLVRRVETGSDAFGDRSLDVARQGPGVGRHRRLRTRRSWSPAPTDPSRRPSTTS